MWYPCTEREAVCAKKTATSVLTYERHDEKIVAGSRAMTKVSERCFSHEGLRNRVDDSLSEEIMPDLA